MGKKPLFTLGGIPVRVQPWFFIMILFLGSLYISVGWGYVASWLVIATLSILVHEYGHAIAFRYYGLRPSITLHGMGGLTAASTADTAAADSFTPTKSIIASLAGPLSALVLIGIPSWLYARNLGYEPALILTTRRISSSFALVIIPTFLPTWSSGARQVGFAALTASGQRNHQASISQAGTTACASHLGFDVIRSAAYNSNATLAVVLGPTRAQRGRVTAQELVESLHLRGGVE